MFAATLVAAVLAVSTAGPALAQTQQRSPQECVTLAGFLGYCQLGDCPDSGGLSPLCAIGYSCCVKVTQSQPLVTPDRSQVTGFRRTPVSRRKTLLNPQFECGGQPAPEPVRATAPRDPSAIVFPSRRRRDVSKPAPKPSFPTDKPGSGAVFVTNGAPVPEDNAVGVGVIGSRPPKRPSIQDVLARIGSRPRPTLQTIGRPRDDSLDSNLIPPLPPPRPGRRRGGGPVQFPGPVQQNSPPRNTFPPRGNYNTPRRAYNPPRKTYNPPQRYHKPSRGNFNQHQRNQRRDYYQPRRNYYRQPRNYYHQPRNYHSQRRNHYHPQQSRRPRRGPLERLLSSLGLPTRRRHRRSPQTAGEEEAFETIWREYQERVRAGEAPPDVTRAELLEAYRAAAQEAERTAAPANGGWTCGAVLISERYMLTAAHCLLGGRPQVVRLGDLNLTSAADGAPQEYLVQDVIQHPQYKHPQVYHDLALLRLDRTVQFSEHVKPFCLYDGRRSLVGRVSHVSGWGATEFGGGLSDILLGGNVTVWSQQRCQGIYSEQRGFQRRLPQGITSDLLCAGGGKQDACQGDSGGPMTVMTQRGTRLAGIVSAGIGCGSPGIPGIYTNVARYIDWIDGIVYGGQTA